MLERWKQRARELRTLSYALYLAARHPETPWYAKVLAGIVVGYAFSPIDLIPDPIPVLGYLDDLVLIPLGMMLAVRFVPPAVWEECKAKAQDATDANQPRNWTAALVIVAIWAFVIVLVLRYLWTDLLHDA